MKHLMRFFLLSFLSVFVGTVFDGPGKNIDCMDKGNMWELWIWVGIFLLLCIYCRPSSYR